MEIEKRRAFLINCAYFVVILVLGFLALRYAMPLLAPFIVGALIAWLVRIPAAFLAKRLGLGYKPLAGLCMLVFYGSIGGAIAVGGIKLLTWLRDIMGALPNLYYYQLQPMLFSIFDSIEGYFVHLDPEVIRVIEMLESQLISAVSGLVSDLSFGAVGSLSNLASSLPGLFIRCLLMIISSFFIVLDFDKLVGFCLRQLSDHGRDVAAQVKEYIVGTLFVCIRSYLLIMTITFVEMSIGLTILKIDHAYLIALITAIFDILPVLGTGGIMIPWAIITVLSGKYVLGLGLFVLYLVITIIRNIIEPKIVGGQLGLHPVVTLSSMFVGLQLFGGLGLFGFPIGLSLLRHLNDLGVIHILVTDATERRDAAQAAAAEKTEK